MSQVVDGSSPIGGELSSSPSMGAGGVVPPAHGPGRKYRGTGGRSLKQHASTARSGQGSGLVNKRGLAICPAFQNGGLFGTGPGQGAVKLTLPDAHADFIFSVAGEELGLFFILIIIAIFGFIMLRGLSRLSESQDMFSVLAAGGLLTMFGLQALVHMGSSMHLLPAKGMTLPFVSYGGSSVLSMGLSMGVVLALTRKTRKAGISRGGLSLS